MKVYITFGQGHVHRVHGKTLDCDSVATIECDNYEAGRARAFMLFDDKFHQCVTEDEVTEHFMSHFPRGLISAEPPA